MKMSARNDPYLAKWLQNKCVSHNVQNELWKVLALSVLREISDAIQESSFYSIMCNECTDASNKEQLVICIHWISNSDIEIHEDIIGLHAIDNISASTIVHLSKLPWFV